MKNDLKLNAQVGELEQILNDAENWAREAGVLAKKYFRQTHRVEFKSDESPVTVADKLIEHELKKAIAAKYPEDGIFGEESGVDGSLTENLWIIDPIDGTRSFISGNPFFGLLLAYVKQGVVQGGLISMPILDEIYCGAKGCPSTCNGKPIRVSGQTNIDDAIIYINEGDKLIAEQPQVLDRLLKAGKTRRFSYDCYPHALLSAGHVDCVVDYGLKPYDFLAVSPVVEAAGGIMTDWQGNPLTLSSGGAVVSSASAQLHDDALQLLNP
ncbi:MAG: inositol monophosphatase [Methylocystaceae bacterium]|nr:inositol monophosphatase [Methylocystaceae bacterium]